ncbi:MAG: cyclic-di-AMP receptor [Chloroflexi bacterium]|nr:cyclic-di-AMP receptor [Chloroflexota bacterium]
MQIDRLVLAIVQREDADAAIGALNDAGLAVTVIASVGGFLSASNTTLLMGLRADDVEKAVEVLKARGHHRTVRAPREADIGSATIFVFPLECYVHITPSQPTIDSRCDAGEPGTMKMIVAIVSQQQSDQLLKVLTDWSYRGTLMSTTGGFLHRQNATVLVGARAERVNSILDQIRRVCEQSAEDSSAATIFVLDSAQYERL